MAGASRMVVAIDVGNTTTTFGVYEQGKLASRFSIATQPNRTPDEVTLQLKALAKTRRLHLSRARQIILCSVVPRMSGVLSEVLRSLDAAPVQVVGQDILVPLENRYRYPEQVGQDRLVGAYAAWCEFGAGLRVRPIGRHPTPARRRAARDRARDIIVCDFGTAITIDLVNRAGQYLGGIIAPGIDLSLEALAANTALLPKVDLRDPPELLGRDTANSIRSGVLFGCVALCDGLVTSLKRQYAPQAFVVATGGASQLIAAHAKTLAILRPNLVLDGLYALTLAK